MFKRGADLIIWRCVLEGEQIKILQECHASPYGGHFAGNKTAHKILQFGFYWPTIFKDCFEWVKLCDQCQRMGNISKRHEMPDSCHNRVIRNQQNLYPNFPPTVVVKLLQYSGLGSNRGMGFLCTNNLSEVKNGEFG